MMNYRLLLWLLAVPLYQFIGTTRHEMSHALFAAAQGATIIQIRLLPFVESGKWWWGRVIWDGGHTTWHSTAAPYYVDAVFFGIFFLVCYLAPGMPRWVWINVFVIGVLSPFIDTAYNYRSAFGGVQGDIAHLKTIHGAVAIHSCFLIALVLYSIGTGLALHRLWHESRIAQREATVSNSTVRAGTSDT